VGISPTTIGRLSRYRRTAQRMLADGREYVHSQEIASACRVTAAQVRRDLMPIQISGTSEKGYNIRALQRSLNNLLDDPEEQRVALVGVGNLGRALLGYFRGGHANLKIIAAFDVDPAKVGRVIAGTRTYPMEQIESVFSNHGIGIAILTVPSDEAQGVVKRVVQAGARGVLNFTQVHLRLPHSIFVESVDFGLSLEKVAYFRQRGDRGKRAGENRSQEESTTEARRFA